MCLKGHRQVTLGLGVGDLHFVGQQELGKEPGCQNLLGVRLVEDTDGGTLRDHFGVFRIELGNGPYRHFEVCDVGLVDVHHGCLGTHPGSACGGVNGEDALSGVQKVAGIAGDLEGGEGPGGGMLTDGHQKLPGGVVKQLDFAVCLGITGVLLLQLGDHHVVRGLIDEGDQGILPVDLESTVLVLGHGGFGYLPNEVPGQCFRQLVAQRFHIGFVYITCLGGSHIGNSIIVAVKDTLLQELGYHFLSGGTVVAELTAAQTVLFVQEQIVQRHHRVRAGQIGCNVIRVGDTHIGGGVCGNVGDHIVVNETVVGVKLQLYGDVGIQLLKIFNCFFVDLNLGGVTVVFRPEGDLVIFGGVKAFRHLEHGFFLGAVTAGKAEKQGNYQQKRYQFFHPLVPPLATPSMIRLRKIKNRTISGAEITHTAAIMAGILSLPKPLSRICWMPLDTRK